MKRLLSLLLAAAMLLSLGCFASAEADAELPVVGDVVEGFVVREVRDFPLVGATAVLFEHERTGAQLMYIANADTNRVFDLTFCTRAIDNTGLPHVFEHATLNGSEKYPSTALFFNLSFQTYNTFMNAMTYPLMTTYPVASLSEEQLLKYADFYTDSCLHPMILEDESIYREEAWRYRMASEDDDLTIEGTVYSEMLGAMNLDSTSYYNLLRAAFPGSTIGNISGGDPDFIPDMTWDDLKAYHELFYHPSNSIAYLYGQFEDYAAFLRLLDEAYAPYERREFNFEDPDYTPIEEPVELSLPFPMEAGAGTENRSQIYYGFVCPGVKADPEEEMILNTLTDLLIADASPLVQSLKKALPSGSFASYIETEGPEDMIIFHAQNVNPEDAETFRDTVDSVLASLAETGFSQELVDGVMASLSLSTKLTGESSTVGVDLIPTIAYNYTASGNHFDYFDYVDALDKLDDWNGEGAYAAAIAKWLIGSETTVLVSTYPAPGMRDELDAAKAEALAEVKSSFSPEEISEIVAASNAEDEPDDASALVAQLQAVTVASLPEEVREYDVNDVVGEDGVRRLTAEAGVDDVGQVLLLLDASGLPQEDIHWFALYTALLGELDTDAHSVEELATLMTRYLYNKEIRLSLIDEFGTKNYCPYLRMSWISTDEDLQAGYDLIDELTYHTQFSDTDAILGLVQRNKASLKSDITSNPYNSLLYRALGKTSPLYAYYNYYNNLDFYAFLEAVEQQLNEDPSVVTEKLESIQAYFDNRTNAIVAYAGSADGIAANAAAEQAFFAARSAAEIVPAAYSFEAPADSEALIVDSSVQFNLIVGDYASMGLEGYSADLDAVSALVTDLYLFPMLREQYGVYTPMHGFLSEDGVYFLAYRDPNILETFDVYDALPEFLRGLETDQDTLDGYILSSYSYYAQPEGELSGALSAMLSQLSKEPQDLKVRYMEQLKSLTPEKLEAYAEAYESLMANGMRLTAGGAGAVTACADLYDAIYNPFGAIDASKVEMTDVAEDNEHYEAVRFVYENMLMPMLDEERFGVDEDATVGDLTAALYALLGGDASMPDDAVDFFVENGLLPAGTTADMPLTASDADGLLSIFSMAVGLEYAPLEGADETVLTRGELSEIVMTYVLPLLG